MPSSRHDSGIGTFSDGVAAGVGEGAADVTAGLSGVPAPVTGKPVGSRPGVPPHEENRTATAAAITRTGIQFLVDLFFISNLPKMLK